MEKYYIYLATNRGTHIKDKNIFLRNRAFDTLIHYESQWRAEALVGYLRDNNSDSNNKQFPTSNDKGRFTTA
jgi:HEAT repeat protein